MGLWNEDWGALLVICAPFLTGVAALGLICLATWPRPPKWVRLPAGALGSLLLLWALWHFVFQPVFA
nr:hypothetical protein [uncultured Flavonifractor sp.]